MHEKEPTLHKLASAISRLEAELNSIEGTDLDIRRSGQRVIEEWSRYSSDLDHYRLRKRVFSK